MDDKSIIVCRNILETKEDDLECVGHRAVMLESVGWNVVYVYIPSHNASTTAGKYVHRRSQRPEGREDQPSRG